MILVIVLALVCASAGVLEMLGKGFFSRPYNPDSSDGELVHHEGIVEENTKTATGGHQVLVVSGVRVFVPSSCVRTGWPGVGQHVSIYGTVQIYRGEREILIRDASDIAPLDPPA